MRIEADGLLPHGVRGQSTIPVDPILGSAARRHELSDDGAVEVNCV